MDRLFKVVICGSLVSSGEVYLVEVYGYVWSYLFAAGCGWDKVFTVCCCCCWTQSWLWMMYWKTWESASVSLLVA